MARVPVDLVVRNIREDSRVIIVDVTIDARPQRFRFERVAPSPIELFHPGPSPYPVRHDPKFVAAFKTMRGRSEIIQLIRRWDRGERIDFPVHVTASRRA